jgi:preprotein translocase subunit SecB
MTEEQQASETPRNVALQSLYLKDCSYEAPNTPEVFDNTTPPAMDLDISVESKNLGNDHFEVTVSATVTAKFGDKTGFLVEVQQAGAFAITGFDNNEIGPVLGIYCPNIIFPYAREAISSLVNKGGFPQLLLEPVNFEAMYAQHMEQEQKAH